MNTQSASVFARGLLLVPILVTGLTFGVPRNASADPGAADSQPVPVLPDSTERKILEHMQESSLTRLAGWPGMIFYCPSDQSQSQAIRDICTEAYKTMESLAVKNGVHFHKARNANDVALLPHLTGRLKLVIDLDATDPSTSPSAVAARVSVLAHYTRAVNRAMEFSAGEPSQDKHPLNVPQHVDGVLWESSLIKAGGTQQELVTPIVDGINQRLSAFFADYAKANQ